METLGARLVHKFWSTFRDILYYEPISEPYVLRVEGDMRHFADLKWYEVCDKEEYIRKSSVWVEFHPNERPVFIKDDIGIRFTNTTEHIFDTKLIATPVTIGVDLANGEDRTVIDPRTGLNNPAIQKFFTGKYPSFVKKTSTTDLNKTKLLWWQIEEEKKKQQQKEIIALRNSIRFWHGM